MTAAVRPLYVPGAKALTLIQQRVSEVLHAWASDWIQEPEARRIHVTIESFPSAGQRAHSQDYEWLRSAGGSLWIRQSDADRSTLGRAVVGTELMPHAACADEWVADILNAAWNARSHALVENLLGSPPSPSMITRGLPGELRTFGSGAVQLCCDSLGLHAVVDAGIWRLLPPPDRAATLPGVATLDRAMRRSTLRLEVLLESVEIELPALLDLRDGDVLRLPQKLDQPAAVLCGGKPLARASLGEADGHKGVQLWKLP